MNNKIKLDNSYYLQLDDKTDKYTTDITNLKLTDIKKIGHLVLRIDFKSFNKQDYKKILKRLLHIKTHAKLHKIELGELQEDFTRKIGYLINYDEKNEEQKEFILAINAILYKTRYERYNYIYDTVCNYLDGFFYGKNLYEFKNNKCGEKRNTLSTYGCCRHNKIKWLGPLTKLVICEHLKEDYTCSARCIACKLFTCDYLNKKGIKFRIQDILLLNVFFNPIQKYFIKYMVFTPKEKILRRLMIT